MQCIVKGNAHKKYDLGIKVSLAVTQRDNFIVGALALPGNPFDGRTLLAAANLSSDSPAPSPNDVLWIVPIAAVTESTISACT